MRTESTTVSTVTPANVNPANVIREAASGPEPRSVPVPGRPGRAGLQRALARRFRLPGHADPAPRHRRLALISAWAGTLGFGGSVIALHLLVNLFQADGGWYRPVVTLIGAVGVLATTGAFASIHRRRLPWMLLSVGTVALLAAYLVTAAR